MPLIILLGSIAGVFSVAIIAGAVWVLWALWAGTLVGVAWWILAIVAIAIAASGRFLVLAFFPRGEQEPEVRGSANGGETMVGPDGSRIHVEREGAVGKPTLVLTHGWTLDSQAWFYARRHLSKQYRLILWDLPGLGRSSQPADRHYSVERLAEDLRAVIQQQASANERVTLVGHSIGGMMMLTLCRLHPEFVRQRINGLVFVDTTYTYPLNSVPASALQKALRWPVFEPLLHVTIALWPIAWLMNWLSYFNGTSHLVNRMTVLTGKVTRGQLDTSAWYNAKDHPGVVAKGILAVMRWNEEKTVSGIDIPARVITGSRDMITRPEAAREMSERLPQGDLVTVDPAGHNGLLEQMSVAYGQAIDEAARRFALAPA